MTKEIAHSLTLIATIMASFFVTYTFLSNYELQIIALLFIIYFISKKIIKNTTNGYLLESFLFVFVVTSIVNSTGGASSQFFFLLYFVIFALSLLLEPVTSVTTSLTYAIMYIMISSSSGFSIIQIISLPLLTPFALYLGKEYQKINQQKKDIDLLNRQATQEKTDGMLFFSLILKNQITNIKDAANNFMGDHELSIIKKSIQKIEKLIDDYEKSNS
jgi:hypothetical protein